MEGESNMQNNINILNRVFTKQLINTLIENKPVDILKPIISKYFSDEVFTTNDEVVSKIYSYMACHYRNEYVYINTLFNKILLGRHSLTTTTAITQLPIESSKADLILINGKAVVYEVKTELDTFDRLMYQLEDYYKAFPYVNVVTCSQQYYKLYQMLKDTPTGIYILADKKNTIQQKKEPVENFDNISHKTLFKILRKSEYENIILKHFDKLPDCTRVLYYDECLKLFSTIPIRDAYSSFMIELKKRNKVVDIEKFNNIPYEMKSIVYFSNLKNNQYDKVENFLSKEYEEADECIIHM